MCIKTYLGTLNEYEKDAFKKAQIACIFVRTILPDEELTKVTRSIIKQYGRANPTFYGWDTVLNKTRYKNIPETILNL